MYDIGLLNLQRAHLLMEALLRSGVEDICLSPGSRSTPLVLAAHTLFPHHLHVHFDERALGFYALGLARASKKPVALIVTSGTAVANLLPSVVEASLTEDALVLLTADRPPELRDVGAHQTIDQIRLFGSFTKFFVDLPLCDPLCSDLYISSTTSHAVAVSQRGPVHLNCMIREPFFPSSPFAYSPSSSFSSFLPFRKEPLLPPLEDLAKTLTSSKGLLLLASSALSSVPHFLLRVAKTLNWPILSDVISGGRVLGSCPHHIPYADLIVKTHPDLEFDTIIRIGDRVLSKTISSWLKRQSHAHHIHVSSHEARHDPDLLVSTRIHCEGELFCERILPFLTPSEDNGPWLSFWQESSRAIQEELSLLFAQEEALTEPSILYSLPTFDRFFFSNGMPVRDADLFFFPTSGVEEIFANRGASGIDGNLATIAGIAASSTKPLVAVVGDLTALHDLSSLALIHKSKTPIILIVINNQGGGIFSFLPVVQKEEIFETYVATSHDYGFASFAKAFDLPFLFASTQREWQQIVTSIEENPRTCLIECRTDRKTNVIHHNALYAKIKESLSSYALS